MGEYGAADVYSHKNEVFFVHSVPFTGGVSINFQEKDLRTLPIVDEDEKEIINDYRIGFDGDLDVPATDGNSNNIGSASRSLLSIHSLPEMGSDAGGQIIFKDKISAIYIGERYIKRTHKRLSTLPSPLTRIKFSIFTDFKSVINVGSFFTLTLSDESYVNKKFEVFEFNVNDDIDRINILAYEVEE